MQDLHQSTVEECERQPEARRGADERLVEARTKEASATERPVVQAGKRQEEAREEDERPVQARDFVERQLEARKAGTSQPEASEADEVRVADERPVQARDFDKRQPEVMEADDRHPEVRGGDERLLHARQKETQVANPVEDLRVKLNEEPLPETFFNVSYI